MKLLAPQHGWVIATSSLPYKESPSASFIPGILRIPNRPLFKVYYSPNVPAGLEQLLCNGILSGVPVNLLSLGACIFFVAAIAALVVTWLLLLQFVLLIVVIPLSDTADRLLFTLPPQKDDSLWLLPARKEENEIKTQINHHVVTDGHIFIAHKGILHTVYRHREIRINHGPLLLG